MATKPHIAKPHIGPKIMTKKARMALGNLTQIQIIKAKEKTDNSIINLSKKKGHKDAPLLSRYVFK
jgi:hypothetical protein